MRQKEISGLICILVSIGIKSGFFKGLAVFWNFLGLCNLKRPVGFGSDEILHLEKLWEKGKGLEIRFSLI